MKQQQQQIFGHTLATKLWQTDADFASQYNLSDSKYRQYLIPLLAPGQSRGRRWPGEEQNELCTCRMRMVSQQLTMHTACL